MQIYYRNWLAVKLAGLFRWPEGSVTYLQYTCIFSIVERTSLDSCFSTNYLSFDLYFGIFFAKVLPLFQEKLFYKTLLGRCFCQDISWWLLLIQNISLKIGTVYIRSKLYPIFNSIGIQNYLELGIVGNLTNNVKRIFSHLFTFFTFILCSFGFTANKQPCIGLIQIEVLLTFD